MNKPLAVSLACLAEISLCACQSDHAVSHAAAHKDVAPTAPSKPVWDAFDAYHKAVAAGATAPLFDMLGDSVDFSSPAGAWSGSTGRQKFVETINEHVTGGCRVSVNSTIATVSGDTGVFEYKADGDVMINGQKQPYTGWNVLVIRLAAGKIVSIHGYQGYRIK